MQLCRRINRSCSCGTPCQRLFVIQHTCFILQRLSNGKSRHINTFTRRTGHWYQGSTLYSLSIRPRCTVSFAGWCTESPGWKRNWWLGGESCWWRRLSITNSKGSALVLVFLTWKTAWLLDSIQVCYRNHHKGALHIEQFRHNIPYSASKQRGVQISPW